MSDDQTPPPPPATNGEAATAADVTITAPEENHPVSTVVPKLRSQIQLLEQDLSNANLKIKNLENEISSHESEKRVLTSIASKTTELETEYSTLQQGLISFASEFEAKERLNVKKISFIEYEKKLLWRKLKEREEEMRKFESENARAIEFVSHKLKEWEVKDRHVLDKLSELEDKTSKQGDEFSELKARYRKVADRLSELEVLQEAIVRENVEKTSVIEFERNMLLENLKECECKISELEAGDRKKTDELSELKVTKSKLMDKLSEQEVIEREKSNRISELEARLETTEREKSDKISELEARLEAAEREKRIKLIH